MSAGRTTMIGGGCGLVALGSLALLARYLEMGGVTALANGQADGVFHTLTVGTVLIGLILVIFAPPSRRAENRVRLDLHAAEPTAARRPAPQSAKVAPVVGGNGHGSAATTAVRRVLSPSPQERPAQGKPAAGVRAALPGTNGHGTSHPPAADMPSDPRDELLARLDELNRRANEIKVRYGLGKVSPGGYRRFIDELDVERSKIEALLMEPER